VSDEQEQPPMGVQVILTATAEVIPGGKPAAEPADQPEPDVEEQA
jgi:hypothetical protein